MMRSIVYLLCLGLATALNAAQPGQVHLQSSLLQEAARLPIGGTLELAEFPAGPGILTAYTFRRIDVYAPHARVIVVDAQGEHEVPRSARVHLVGYSKDGLSRVGVSYDPDLKSPPYIAGSGPSGAFVLQGEALADGWRLHAVDADAALPAGVRPQILGTDDALSDPNAAPEWLDHLIASEAPEGVLRNALVAVDTDSSFMLERFSNNTSQATAWIADLFAQMNVMYQRDLAVNLQVGTTFLRPGSDPYANTDTPANSAMLAEFGNYWQANYSGGGNAVDRDFALLLSGNSNSGNSASGIAWVNAYCLTSGGFGSYSTNQVFTNPAIGVSLSASLVGHELGHNFGAAHTHCTNVTTGVYPTGTNTIDRCSTIGTGCYSGTTSCPSSGPGAPLGTVMSYCNLNSCGQNVQQFHPTHITQLLIRIAANTPSCLSLGIDLIFEDGFE
jgi:hypothetical protein